jgi:DNA-binding response OmpR family regulator
MSLRRVLIVDDQPLLCEFMVAAAQDAGWEAEAVVDATAPEQALNIDHPDLLVLDLNMPDRDGIELLRYLSRMGFRGKLLIVSGCDSAIIDSSGALAREHGLNLSGCLQKPVPASRFRAMLLGL